ncbi:Pentatricopeptide repeat-containing protein [Nymphaea thermarum]|nr:Pentatricopeptide repeat-containing protein [Nymphaea thermarum]
MITCGLINDTHQAASSEHAFHRIFDNIKHPNVVIWNTMMKIYVSESRPECAILLYKSMLRGHSPAENFTFPILIQACTLRAWVEEGEQLHNHVVKLGFGSDAYVGNTLIHMYSDTSLLRARTSHIGTSAEGAHFCCEANICVYEFCEEQAGATSSKGKNSREVNFRSFSLALSVKAFSSGVDEILREAKLPKASKASFREGGVFLCEVNFGETLLNMGMRKLREANVLFAGAAASCAKTPREVIYSKGGHDTSVEKHSEAMLEMGLANGCEEKFREAITLVAAYHVLGKAAKAEPSYLIKGIISSPARHGEDGAVQPSPAMGKHKVASRSKSNKRRRRTSATTDLRSSPSRSGSSKRWSKEEEAIPDDSRGVSGCSWACWKDLEPRNNILKVELDRTWAHRSKSPSKFPVAATVAQTLYSGILGVWRSSIACWKANTLRNNILKFGGDLSRAHWPNLPQKSAVSAAAVLSQSTADPPLATAISRDSGEVFRRALCPWIHNQKFYNISKIQGERKQGAGHSRRIVNTKGAAKAAVFILGDSKWSPRAWPQEEANMGSTSVEECSSYNYSTYEEDPYHEDDPSTMRSSYEQSNKGYDEEGDHDYREQSTDEQPNEPYQFSYGKENELQRSSNIPSKVLSIEVQGNQPLGGMNSQILQLQMDIEKLMSDFKKERHEKSKLVEGLDKKDHNPKEPEFIQTSKSDKSEGVPSPTFSTGTSSCSVLSLNQTLVKAMRSISVADLKTVIQDYLDAKRLTMGVLPHLNRVCLSQSQDSWQWKGLHWGNETWQLIWEDIRKKGNSFYWKKAIWNVVVPLRAQ